MEQTTTGRDRDLAIRAAVRAGSAIKDLAALIDVSTQAIYQAIERAGSGDGPPHGAYAKTITELAAYSDPSGFEELVMVLLAESIGDLRPTQRSGDRGRDAVAGLLEPVNGEELVVTISLERDWSSKVRRDMRRVADQGLRPKEVRAVTNRETTENRLSTLYKQAADHGWTLTVFDARWLATQLMRPDRVELREHYLGLPRPRPPLFLQRHEFETLLGAEPTEFVGRADALAEIEAHLAEEDVVILDGPGGIGKSRLLLELAGRLHLWRPLFVKAGLPFNPVMLHETDVGDDVAIYIDDAHRRDDLGALLAGLERRSPRPRIVLASRPGFNDALRRTIDGLAFGPAHRVAVGSLPRAEMAAMLAAPPLSIRLEGLRLAIVELAEGNPQIAAIAARATNGGLPLQELSRDDLLRNYASRVLLAAVGDSRERLAIVALVAAVGSLSRSRESLARAGQLVGLTWQHVRRELEALTETGMLTEHGDLVQIKPDVLAEHILVSCFFDRTLRPALDYEEIFDAFEATDRVIMLTALGQALRAAPDDVRASTLHQPVTRRLLAACSQARSSVERVEAAAALALVAPGLPAVATRGFDVLLEAADDAELPDITTPLLDIATRVVLDAGWPRMLALTQRVFAGSAIEDPFVESPGDDRAGAAHRVVEAFKELHSRLPTQVSPDDSRVLAAVQELLTLLTTAWWRGRRGRPGAAPTALLAARTMLRVIYEVTTSSAESLNHIRMVAVGVADDEATRRCLTAGLHILLECLPHLTLRGQSRALEVLRSLAHPALDGMTGPFGLELSAATRTMINELVDELVVPWVHEHLAELELPTAAGVVDFFEWRAYFGQSAPAFDLSNELAEYRMLIAPGEPWSGLDETIAEQRERYQRVAERFAQQLVDDDPDVLLARWADWHERSRRATAATPWDDGLALTLEAFARRDPDRGVEAIDGLLAGTAPLVAHVGLAMTAIVKDRPHQAERWVTATSPDARCALAWAATSIDDEAIQRRVLDALAGDANGTVRRAVARALRHRTSLAGWRAELALRLAADDDDLQVLYELLHTLSERGAAIPEPVRIGAALMRVATQPVREQGHRLARVFDALERAGHTPPIWAWVWRRIECAANTEYTRGFAEAIPEAILTRLARSASEPASQPHLERALEWLDEDPSYVVERALLRLVALFDDDERLAAHLTAWAADGRRELVRKLLEETRPWERYERLAAAVLATDPSEEMIATVVVAREPRSFIGSQIGYHEHAREPFRAWRGHHDGNLVRAAEFAEQFFERRIAEARAEEARYLEL